MHFVRFTAVAATAELRCAVAGRGVAGIIPAAHEEMRRLDPDGGSSVEIEHVVLIVAGCAGDPRIAGVGSRVGGALRSRHLDQIGYGPILRDIKIVIEESTRSGSIEADRAVGVDGAIPVILTATADDRHRTHRMVVQVISRRRCVIPEQRRRVESCSVDRYGFISCALHHAGGCNVAIVTAQASGDDEDAVPCTNSGGQIGGLDRVAPDSNRGCAIVWDRNRESKLWLSTPGSHVPEDKGLTVERRKVLAPQRKITAVRAGRCAVRGSATVRRMAGDTTTTVHVVRSENVLRRRRNLG